MRSIQIINVRWFNATAWYALSLGKLLQEKGHPVLILALPNTPPMEKAREWGLPVRGLPLNTKNPFRFIFLLAELQKIVREFKPHIVNCHRGESFFLWPLLQRGKTKFALIRTRGDQRLPKNNLANRILHKHLCQAIITTNSRIREHFHQNFGLKKEKLHLVYGGVDLQNFHPACNREKIREKLGVAPGHFLLGLLGRLDTVKGQKELIEAVGALYHKEQCTDIRLLLIGFSSAISENTVHGWIKDNGLENICHISGKVPNVADYISALDLGIINSQWSEAIARGGMEIMACNIPLVSTRVGVLPELLPQEALFPPGEPELLREKIRQLHDKERRQDILAKEQKRMSELSSENFLQKTLGIYSRAIGEW